MIKVMESSNIKRIAKEIANNLGVRIKFSNKLKTCTYDYEDDVIKINPLMLKEAIEKIFDNNLKGIYFLILHEYYHRYLIRKLSHSKLEILRKFDLEGKISNHLIQDYVIDHLLINDKWYLTKLLNAYKKYILSKSDFRKIQAFYITTFRNPIHIYVPYHVIASYSIKQMLNINEYKDLFTKIELRFITYLRDIYERVGLNNWFNSISVVRYLIKNFLDIKTITKIVKQSTFS